jgi:effector-binding domain-containing protein
MHKGSYEGLGAAYAAALNWIEHNGYEATDNPRESYIDGIWNKNSKDEWLTEVQIPIKKAVGS